MKLRITGHETRTNSAEVSTITAEFNTFSHHLNHLTTEASISAKFAVLQTFQTVLNTGIQH
jgi:hypothetical protein